MGLGVGDNDGRGLSRLVLCCLSGGYGEIYVVGCDVSIAHLELILCKFGYCEKANPNFSQAWRQFYKMNNVQEAPSDAQNLGIIYTFVVIRTIIFFMILVQYQHNYTYRLQHYFRPNSS